MSNSITISPSRARSIILHAAGLARPAQFGKGKEAVFRFIDHLGFLQIDSNYIIERAHHHSIWARIPDYNIEWLYELQDEGRIFEFWTFASGFIPMTDYRYSFPVKEALAARWKPATQKEVNLMNQILDRVAREGPLMARDFENDRVTKSTGWWDWRPSKVALERLHFSGQLMTTRRRDFQKTYDLPDNLVRGDIERTPPTREAFARHVVLRSLGAWGIGHVKDIGYRGRYVKSNAIKSELQKLVDEGLVCTVEVNGIKTGPLYMLSSYKNRKITLSDNIFILSPFDVMNVLRHRLKYYFNFDYQVECFVPEKKRKYGYFALPVLYGDTFIARMDAKADRKQGILLINNLHFEQTGLGDTAIKKLAKAIRDFARFNDSERICFVRTNNKTYVRKISAQLSDINVEMNRTK